MKHLVLIPLWSTSQINERVAAAPAGGAGRPAQQRTTKLQSISESPPARFHLTSLTHLHPTSPAHFARPFTPHAFSSVNSLSDPRHSSVSRRVQRCSLVRRWSLCACSRPNRSTFGLSSYSSRCTAPDRGLLSFMMWVNNRLFFVYHRYNGL